MQRNQCIRIKFVAKIKCTAVNKKSSVYVKRLELKQDDILTVEYVLSDMAGAANGQYASYVYITNDRTNKTIIESRNKFFGSIVPDVFEFIQE